MRQQQAGERRRDRGLVWGFIAVILLAPAITVWLGHTAAADDGVFGRAGSLATGFTAIAVLVVAFFSYQIFYVLRQVPASAGAPRVGQKAPDFLLLDQNGKPVGLGDLLSNSKGVLLIFYRGFW